MKYKEIPLMRHLINEHVLLISETFLVFSNFTKKMVFVKRGGVRYIFLSFSFFDCSKDLVPFSL